MVRVWFELPEPSDVGLTERKRDEERLWESERIGSHRLPLRPSQATGGCIGSGRRWWVRVLLAIALVEDEVGQLDVSGSFVEHSRRHLRPIDCCCALLPRWHRDCLDRMDCRSRK